MGIRTSAYLLLMFFAPAVIVGMAGFFTAAFWVAVAEVVFVGLLLLFYRLSPDKKTGVRFSNRQVPRCWLPAGKKQHSR
jgi:hypothetical protein